MAADSKEASLCRSPLPPPPRSCLPAAQGTREEREGGVEAGRADPGRPWSRRTCPSRRWALRAHGTSGWSSRVTRYTRTPTLLLLLLFIMLIPYLFLTARMKTTFPLPPSLPFSVPRRTTCLPPGAELARLLRKKCPGLSVRSAAEGCSSKGGEKDRGREGGRVQGASG